MPAPPANSPHFQPAHCKELLPSRVPNQPWAGRLFNHPGSEQARGKHAQKYSTAQKAIPFLQIVFGSQEIIITQTWN